MPCGSAAIVEKDRGVQRRPGPPEGREQLGVQKQTLSDFLKPADSDKLGETTMDEIRCEHSR